MFKAVSEQEFLAKKGMLIEYIGIYELDWIIDDNQLDCEGIIVAYADKKYLILSQAINMDEADFFYYEFNEDYECRKILSIREEPLYFIRKEKKEKCHPILRFQIGERPILVTALEDDYMTIGISHWDINDEWLDYDNWNLLNDI